MKRILAVLLSTILTLSGCSSSLSTSEPENTASTTALKDKKLIALTFDDGPNESVMPMILDVLEQYDVPATFFLIGRLINETNAHVVKRAYDMGCEIANHSYSHEKMGEMSESEIQEQINKVQDAVVAITGEAPKCFRPPFLNTSEAMYNTISMPFISGFSFGDWKAEVTVQERIDGVLGAAKDGAVILLHCSSSDGGSMYNPIALKTIIPSLIEEGYGFVTVSQLFELRDVTHDSQKHNMYKIIG